MSAEEIEVRTLPSDRHAEVLQMRIDAFSVGGTAKWPAEGQPHYVPDDRRLGAFKGEELLAHAAVWSVGQWMLGKQVQMGAVASVISKPEARGRGVGDMLMRRMLLAEREWGDAVSCLYPTAPGFYRRLGWAFAGNRWAKTIRTDALHALHRPADPPQLDPFDFEADFEEVTEVLDAAASRGHGRIARDSHRHRGMLEPDEEIRAWVARRGGDVVGFLQIDRAGSEFGDRSMRRQHIAELAAAERDTWLALWRLVASESTVVQFTSYVSGPHDLLQDELSLPAHDVDVREQPWMARLIDVRAAIAQRGWPTGSDLTVPIQITDPILRHNAGTFHLMVSRGAAELAPARRSQSTAVIDVGSLSALYTGHASAESLRRSGRLVGGSDADVAALDSAFSSPQPHMHDYF